MIPRRASGGGATVVAGTSGLSAALRPMRARLLFFLLLATACGAGPDDSGATSAAEADAQLRARLGGLRVARVIGREEGADGEVFGLIADARADASGRAFVLDERFHRIAAYDAAGALIGFGGRPGRGPGEFRSPRGLAWLDDSLLALDVGSRSIHVFEIAPGGLSFARSIRLPFLARSFCTLGRRIFLAGLHEDATVHEIDEAGVILRSFGQVYGAEEIPPGPFRHTVRETMSVGKIACSADPEVIVTIAQNRPDVTAYTPDGRTLWRTTLAGYSQLTPHVTERGTMQYHGDSETGGQHSAQGVLIWPPDLVLVQLAYLSDAGYRSSDEAPPGTRVLDLATGRELATVDSLPRLAAVDGGRALGFLNTPFPRLLVLEVPPVPGG